LKDHVIPFARYGRPLLEMIPHAKYVPLRGCGHGCMFDDPDLVVQTILQVTQAATPESTTRQRLPTVDVRASEPASRSRS
jgi:hypothetical protein